MAGRRACRFAPASHPPPDIDAAPEDVAMRYDFETPSPPRVSVRIPSGRLDLVAEETDRTIVEVEVRRGDEEDVLVEQRGGEIVIEARKRFGFLREAEYIVLVRAPHGLEAETETSSADVRIRGPIAALSTKTASGDVDVEQADGEARVRSASGDVSLQSVGGRADVNTASGDVELGSVGGEISIRTASGDVRVGEAGAGVSIYTASGDQELSAAVQGSVDLKSASGDVRVGIKRGSRVYVDARSMSGDTTSELELGGVATADDGPLVELKAVTMSGDITLVRA
jgi:DUF4097 and DUF4098 domain-containing protein YvlB